MVPAFASGVVAWWPGAERGGEVRGRVSDGVDDLAVDGGVDPVECRLDFGPSCGVARCSRSELAGGSEALSGFGQVDGCAAFGESGCLDPVG